MCERSLSTAVAGGRGRGAPTHNFEEFSPQRKRMKFRKNVGALRCANGFTLHRFKSAYFSAARFVLIGPYLILRPPTPCLGQTKPENDTKIYTHRNFKLINYTKSLETVLLGMTAT